MLEAEWSAGIQSEVDFWRHWLETKGDRWPEDYTQRTDPSAPVDPWVFGFLGSPRKVSVLDVGSGPLTMMGKVWGDARIDLSACDALGAIYAQLPYPEGLPLIEVAAVKSEELSKHYPPNSFDLVYARNTLDHGIDPLAAVTEMIRVAKPGGLIVSQHWPNEGTRENWEGFHQWDLYVASDDWLMRNKAGDIVSITSSVRNYASQIYISPPEACVVVFEKLAAL